jgi:hypothetical protein
MRMTDLNQIFFNASKRIDTTKYPTRFNVRGNPYNPNNFIDYKDYKRDFTFVTYKDVVCGGILRCKLLFNKPFNDLELHKLNFGRNKQWFVSEIIAKGYSVKIDGEDHFPFLTVSYSYDAVNSIKYDIGVYRSKCTNGVIFGYKSLLKLKVTPDNLFDLEIWFNNCLLLALLKEYERNVVLLKRIKLDRETINQLVNMALGLDNNKHNQIERLTNRDVNFLDFSISSISESYIHELGSNGYAALNTISDLATNYRLKSHKNIDSIDNTVLAKQRLAGQWLDQFIRFAEHYNKVEVIKDIESELLGSKPNMEEYKFDLREFENFVRNENSKDKV